MKENKTVELFVPGRLCLFGEHSDWAGRYRINNSSILPGKAIVSGTGQGISAIAKKSDKFCLKYLNDIYEMKMDADLLKQEAANGGFYSYAAGVACYMKEHYDIDGIEIEITDMNLPMKKGLSSSAAICVLVARAFNKIYDLQISIKGEMDIAYHGEILTPSRCGRLDQACAYGSRPILMQFDGDDTVVKPLKVGSDFYWVFADLKSKKDTIKILADLNKAFPFPSNDSEKAIHEALGIDNTKIVDEAISCIEKGNAQRLGELMTLAQEIFDNKAAPLCMSELTAPKLHEVLSDETVKSLTYGGKGVGSQGDGTIQFLAKDEESKQKLISYLEKQLGLDAFELTLRAYQPIKKAIITVAGFGTRLYPATRFIKKELFPVIDSDGLAKPVLLLLLEELDAAGIEEICLVVGPKEDEFYSQLFNNNLGIEHFQKLPNSLKEYEDKIKRIGKKITYAFQEEKRGFGHAVYQAKDFVKDEPVLLLLCDYIYKSNTKENCASQIMEMYQKYGKSIISLTEVDEKDVVHYGILSGEWLDKKETILNVSEFAEKPSIEYAKDYLKTKQDGHLSYYGVFGQYVLTPKVFKTLGMQINSSLDNNNIGLTEALDKVKEEDGLLGFTVDGQSYDIGIPEKYLETINAFSRKRKI